MILLTQCPSIRTTLTNCNIRYLSKYLDKDKMSRAVRRKFLDFFINDNNHNFVRSSPVVPYCDPTVAFVNAGMNQFKGIFLGTQTPTYKRVANSQKCVRVGGKHNDLNSVGIDGYHHTFFEMLGSWSFGDYFKKEACELSWKLLTAEFKINKSSLYVTYFGGDEGLGLKPDLECKEIWRSIGVPEDRILPFGMTENFWEMGQTGPCGPCTEIHVDHRGSTNRSRFVNKGLHDLTEIWNIVFIQYNRNQNNTINPLPVNHIDTGMGFERLCALLQGKTSNYDTDIFTPIFSAIHKSCKGIPEYTGLFGEKDWNSLNAHYRILADHSRMVTVCLGDGMIPEENQKLRRVMRKAFLISETTFKKKLNLLKEMSNYVVDSLGSVYTEMEKNINQIHQIIDYEQELYKSLRTSSTLEWNKIIEEEPLLSNLDILETPGLVSAYKEIANQGVDEITPEFALKLYDTYGLEEDVIIKLSNALNLSFNAEGFKQELEMYKCRSLDKNSLKYSKIVEKLMKINRKPTNDSFKYNYGKVDNEYQFKDLESTVEWLIQDDEFVTVIEPNVNCIVIFDRTNFYIESGGQDSDKGHAVYNDGFLEITDLEVINGLILHKGNFKSNSKLEVGKQMVVKVNEESRLKNMMNHTATHLLNASLKKVKGATCQKSSKVTGNYLNLDVGIFNTKLSINDIKKIENEVNRIIKDKITVETNNVNSQQLFSLDNVTLIPGEIYPDTNIRLVEIIGKDFLSREPCCGTHVINTADIQDFCIVSYRSLGRSTASIHAVTGSRAKLCRDNGLEMLDKIAELQKNVHDNIDKPEVLDSAVTALRQRLKYNIDDEFIIPAVVKHDCMQNLDNISRQIRDAAKGTLKEFIEMEMKSVMESKILTSRKDKEFIVHYLRSSMILESVPLQRATKLCTSIPVLVISYSDNMVKARCCVPKNLRTDDFNALKWLSQISTIFKSTAVTPKGQDATLVCNMKPKHINIQDWDTLLKQSLDTAKTYAEEYL